MIEKKVDRPKLGDYTDGVNGGGIRMDGNTIDDMKRFIKTELEDRIDGLEVIDSKIAEWPGGGMAIAIEGIVASYGGMERVIDLKVDEQVGMMSDLADVVRGKLGIKR